MELQIMPNGNGQNHALTVAFNNETTARKAFIEANTIQGTLPEIRQNHIIPVFTKDNETTISQVDFIETTQEVISSVFPGERILSPSVRLSHPIKGRIPEARNKPATELESWERTIYYERMAFIIEVPSISDNIGGEKLSLTIGGVKAYNLDNLNGKKGSDEHFKVFIGFKVSVCTNLCVWTDGFASDVRVKNLHQLKDMVYNLVKSFNAIAQLKKMDMLQNYALTERQFAQLIGRARMYQHLPTNLKLTVPELHFGDSQINSVCKDYYRENSFCRDENGDINLWKLYNLFTAANKQSYIDTFVDRAVNASSFVEEISYALEHKTLNWFLS
ncbi:MAG: DUF3871 family protein [Flavisolibacter sp.]